MTTTDNADRLLSYLMNEIKSLDVFHPRNKGEVGQWMTLYSKGLAALTGISFGAISFDKFVDSSHMNCRSFNLEVLKFRVSFRSENHFCIDYTADDFYDDCWRYEYDAKYAQEFPYFNEKVIKKKGRFS